MRSVLVVTFSLIFFIINQCSFVKSAKILAAFGIPVKSHQEFFSLIWKELALRGHDVTVLTLKTFNDPTITNLIEIDLSFGYERFEEFNITKTFQHETNFLSVMKKIAKPVIDVIGEELSHPKVKELLNNTKSEFDVVLVEAGIPPFYYLAEYYNCPLIFLGSLPPMASIMNDIGNPMHPAVTPDINLPFGKRLSFIERIISTIYQIRIVYIVHNLYLDLSEKLIRKIFGVNVDLDRILKNKFSLAIANVVPEINNVHPKMPNLIEINGLHLTKPAPLPSDLKDFLDGANDGAIYFSLGTFASQKVEEKFKIFAEIFSELPYKVVWKMDENNLESVWVSHLKNVFVRSYFESQQDILRHPNVKCFITQGGLHSLEETMAYQVPIVGLPILGDQFGNVKKMVESGMGIEVDFKKSGKNEMKSAILEVIQNPKYLDRIKQVSKYVFDKPMKPMDEIIWWIEYVIRHKGAYHLRSPFNDLSLYKYLMLDILLPTVSLLILFIFIVYKLIKMVIYRLVKFKKSKID